MVRLSVYSGIDWRMLDSLQCNARNVRLSPREGGEVFTVGFMLFEYVIRTSHRLNCFATYTEGSITILGGRRGSSDNIILTIQIT